MDITPTEARAARDADTAAAFWAAQDAARDALAADLRIAALDADTAAAESYSAARRAEYSYWADAEGQTRTQEAAASARERADALWDVANADRARADAAERAVRAYWDAL